MPQYCCQKLHMKLAYTPAPALTAVAGAVVVTRFDASQMCQHGRHDLVV